MKLSQIKMHLAVWLIIGFSSWVNAQVGISFSYETNDFPDWYQYQYNSEEILPTSYEIGFDYWFRLKEKRVEFFPGVSYQKSKASVILDSNSGIEHQAFALNFATHFYLLDFGGDCNCPTFSKQGPGIEKGFFVHLTPSIFYNLYSLRNDVIEFDPDTKSIDFKLGLGAGIDLGITDFITITPMYSYNYYFSEKFDYPLTGDLTTFSSNKNQNQFSLRLGLRFDYKKR
ncbi:MAG: autotransporter domain-containing protein [Saprospiraceae bacterium]|nr:autotransporter domain-containing protein [Saprospiraceae bacterium]